MTVFIIWRLCWAILSIVAMSAMLFFSVAGLLGSPAAILLGNEITKESLAQLNEQLGFNRSLFVQYFEWVGHVLTGNFGQSYMTKQPVIEMILPRIPVTIEIGLLAIALATTTSVLSNTIPSGKRYIRPLIDGISIAGITLPNFIIGTFLVYLFAVYFGLLPALGWAPWSEGVANHFYHITLPVVTLSFYAFGSTTLVYRAEYDKMSSQPFVRIARAKGLSRWVVAFKHVMPNSVLPVVTLVGINLGHLLGGAIVTETLFAVPGLGTLFVESIMSRDYSLMLAQGMLMIVGVIVFGAITDILYTVVNPQIRVT